MSLLSPPHPLRLTIFNNKTLINFDSQINKKEFAKFRDSDCSKRGGFIICGSQWRQKIKISSLKGRKPLGLVYEEINENMILIFAALNIKTGNNEKMGRTESFKINCLS
jgi:hypothetical protein